MSTPSLSFGGIASGLPADLIDQLMAAERLPLQRLERSQRELDVVSKAWSSVQTRLSAVRDAVDAVRRPGDLASQFSAASTDADVVGATVTGEPGETALTFSVEQLARRMQQTNADRFSGLDDDLAGRTLSINGQEINVGSGATLGDLIDAVDAADLGVEASALEVEPGEHQLVLAAEETGAVGGFTVSGSGWTGSFVVTQAAQDAQLDVGGITVTRASNEIDDLVEGIALDLRRADPGAAVTVSVAHDIDEAVSRVTTVVEEINKTLDLIDQVSRYDPATGRSGPLRGESVLRRLAGDLRSAISSPVEGAGTLNLASEAGVNLTRNGRVEVDEVALREAFQGDFQGTARLFARAGGSTASEVAEVITSSRETQAGEYDVEIARAATVASLTGAIEVPPPTDPQRYRISGGEGSAVVTITGSMSVSQAIAEIQDALADEGIDHIEPDDDGGQVRLRETRHGSAHEITVERESSAGVWEQASTSAGADVEVLVDGQAHVGEGQRVAIDSGTAEGLRLRAAGAAGQTVTLTVSHGVGGALDRVLARAEGPGGSIRRAQDSLGGQSERLQDRIDAFEQRLEVRETTLRRKFTAMESTLARLMDEGQWLQGQLGGLLGGQ